MRVPCIAAAILVALCTPVPATAGSFSFFVTGGTDLVVSFSAESFTVSDDLLEDHLDPVVFPFSGSATLVSGERLALVVDAANGSTTYSYGEGTLTLTMSADDEFGHQVDGTAVFPTLPFSFTVCEGCDSLFGGGLANDFAIQLGSGLFDQPLADALGIRPEAGGGFIDFGLEAITGDPSTAVRLAADHRGFARLQIDVTEVPEPAALWLLLAGGTAWTARRRRATGVTTSERPDTSRARTSGRR